MIEYCGLCTSALNKQLDTITISAVSFLCKQGVKEVYKQYKDLLNGPSIQYYMQYEAKEIDLSCYCEAKKIGFSTYCETIKWCVVDYSTPLQV